tara:strand:- start:1191 stop:1421 length:231 start_codon:yes stop_codon:yes gene_type:complete
MCGHPGFFEWLLSRNNETSKVGSEWKFGLVQLLLKKKHIIKAHFGDVVVKDVMVYEKQGVFYKPYQAKVEVASAHQ